MESFAACRSPHPAVGRVASLRVPVNSARNLLHLKQLLPHEAVRGHQVLELLEVQGAHVDLLLVVALLVEEHEDRTVVRDEVDPEPHVCVSVPFGQHEPPHLRQLVQASSGAALHLGRPRTLDCHLHLGLLPDLCCTQALFEELIKVVALPTGDVRTDNALGLLVVLQLNGRHGALQVLHLQAGEERRLTLDEVVQVLISLLLASISDEASDAKTLDLLRLLATAKALLHDGLLAATLLLQALAQQPAGAAAESLGVEALVRTR
mmetsp:Transcript_54628/g.171521  ORF Transcript_54628/g.171521 Transcript_54628/m.171521 type:complete len:264 (-) Transcript_54628:262-1053(-)